MRAAILRLWMTGCVLAAAPTARAQVVEFRDVPTVAEVLRILDPDNAAASQSLMTPRVLVDPTTNADLTVAPPGVTSSPPPRPAPVPVPQAARPARGPGPTSIAQPAIFAVGRTELPAALRQLLDVMAQAMALAPSVGLVISGHTDSTGSPEINEPLSQGRADAARAYLIGKGVAEDRVTAIGQGARMPLPGLAADSPANRRIQFWRRQGTG